MLENIFGRAPIDDSIFDIPATRVSMLSGIRIVPRDNAGAEEKTSDTGEASARSPQRSTVGDADTSGVPAGAVSDQLCTPSNPNATEYSLLHERTHSEQMSEPALKRDVWMTIPAISRSSQPDRPTQGIDTVANGSKGDIKRELVELNPYLRDGGTGLPVDDGRQQQNEDTHGRGETTPPSRSTVGDGGASWRMKALNRARSQAATQGTSVAEVVKERWGSLSELTAGIIKPPAGEGKRIHAMAHLQAARDRRREHCSGDDVSKGVSSRRSESKAGMGQPGKSDSYGRRGDEGPGKGAYLIDVGSSRSRMRKPSEMGRRETSLSWKKYGNSKDMGGTEQLMRKPRQENPSEDNGALQSIAAELNSFANDGSFFEKIRSEQPTSQQNTSHTSSEIELSKGKGKDDDSSSHDATSSGKARDSSSAGKARTTGNQSPQDRQDRSPTKASSNKSAAALLRSRLAGKIPVKSADSGDRTEEASRASEADAETTRDVSLPLIDSKGRPVPGAFGRETVGAVGSCGEGYQKQHRRDRRVQRYDADGTKARYYADDDDVDLDTLVKRTKYKGAPDLDDTMARNIILNSRFKSSKLDPDAEYDYDEGLELAETTKKPSKRARRQGNVEEEAAARERRKQARDFHKYQKALDRCTRCFTSASRPRHLLIAAGNAAYLALPDRGRLTPGHCCIVPAEHIASVRTVDENVCTELRNFKKCLLLMFQSKGLDVIFLETALQLGDVRVHAVVDCIPMAPDGTQATLE